MTVAAIDIGSNSVRLLILDRNGVELERDVTVTGLGTGIEATGRFDPGSMSLTLDVIGRYAEAISRHPVEAVKAVATSASRDAANGEELMTAIGTALGERPVIIDGDAEANLAFNGSTLGSSPADRKLVIDIGGGSTEVVIGREAAVDAISIDIGSVRLTDAFVTRRPVSPDVVAAMGTHADIAFAPISIDGPVDQAIGVAGTLTNLSAMAMHLEVYDRSIVDGSHLSLSTISDLIKELSTLSIVQTEMIPSLDPKRARVILAGAVIAESVLKRCGINDVRISERDLLDGLALELLQTIA
ncbi:MAG: exopolyphosphatase [Proteobacteria bacterium]|nr:exopolyphosphatase [Pseudomonadota bacterium]